MGVSPAHEHRCFAEGKASMSMPISEKIPMAVNLLLKDGVLNGKLESGQTAISFQAISQN